MKTSSDYTSIDYAHLWHPFTHQQTWFEFAEPLIIERGEGFELIDVEGNRYLDGVSSLWCNVHGHGHPKLLAALQEQAEKLCHSTLLGLSHTAILELTERLVSVAPAGLTRAFYSDSGTSAVEAGLRMALEWWQKQPGDAARKRTKLVSLEGAYHGDTIGAVSVGFLDNFHRDLQPIVVPARRTPPPQVLRVTQGLSDADALEASVHQLHQLFEREGDEFAAMFIEPLVQGAAGMWIHPPEFLREVAEVCRKHDVLLIADEVATGFGKTGKLFAVEHADVQPDIMTVGKGLSAGYLPISAALTSEKVFSSFVGGPADGRTFYYGQTYAGNPLAAAVSVANLDLFAAEKPLESFAERAEIFSQQLAEQIAPLAHVFEVRRFGFMVGIELTATAGDFQPYPAEKLVTWKLIQAARERGVLIRPLGNIIVLMPAVTMGEDDLRRLVGVTAEAIQEATES